LKVLKYTHENGLVSTGGRCPWDSKTCENAARGGHLEVLKYAHENRCPWDWKTCADAASGGHLECLKYAHENGCYWDWRTCYNATSKGIWKYLNMSMRTDVLGTKILVNMLQREGI
jgi:hypothetical protein